jgi:hypothetical protein
MLLLLLLLVLVLMLVLVLVLALALVVVVLVVVLMAMSKQTHQRVMCTSKARTKIATIVGTLHQTYLSLTLLHTISTQSLHGLSSS